MKGASARKTGQGKGTDPAPTQSVAVCRWREGTLRPDMDDVADEVPFLIRINGRAIARLLCTPLHRDYLGFGFLKLEGYIASPDEVKRITRTPTTFSVSLGRKTVAAPGIPTRLTGCAGGITYRAVDRPLPLFDRCVSLLHAFPGERVTGLYREFLEMDVLHRETGGTHSAALATADGILFSTCDVGRHNAVQKLAGWALLNRRVLDDVCILTTGRISSEIVEYAARMGAPVVVSRAAPTLLAVRKALDEGITLLGFVRGRRMNAYSHPERLQ